MRTPATILSVVEPLDASGTPSALPVQEEPTLEEPIVSQVQVCPTSSPGETGLSEAQEVSVTPPPPPVETAAAEALSLLQNSVVSSVLSPPTQTLQPEVEELKHCLPL